MLSTAASCSFFTEEEEQGVDEVASLASQAFSHESVGSSARESVSGRDTVRPAMRMALARLGLDEAPVSSARPASSLRAYGVHLCLIPGRGPLWYPVLITFNLVQMNNRGASASLHRLTSSVALCHGWHFRRQEVRRPAATPQGP